MANNRMFLIHRPSTLGVMLGKSMGADWYKAPDADELERFYSVVFNDSCCSPFDDFVLAMEVPGSKMVFGGWQYTGETKDGFKVFDFIGVDGDKK